MGSCMSRKKQSMWERNFQALLEEKYYAPQRELERQNAIIMKENDSWLNERALAVPEHFREYYKLALREQNNI